MALEHILRSIRAGADAEVRELEAAAAAEVAAIAARAEADARAAEEAAATSLDRPTEREATRIVDRARLDARRGALHAVEVVYEETLGVLRARLDGIRPSDDYPEIFARLFDEASGVLPRPTSVIVDPADLELARAVVAERGGDIAVEPSLSCAGGLDLASDHERIVRNTLESRLERADGRLRGLVASHLPEGIT